MSARDRFMLPRRSGPARQSRNGAGATENGAEAVEFALLVPILLALVYGIIAFGLLLNSQVTATQLAREGARAAAICSTSGGCTAIANTAISKNLPAGFTLTSVAVTTCTSATADATVVITAQAPLSFVPLGIAAPTIHGKSTTPCGG
jgi:Flp pilus assembly protein TadG